MQRAPTMWRVDAAGNVQPWRPGTPAQPAAASAAPDTPLLPPTVSDDRRLRLAHSLTLRATDSGGPRWSERRQPDPIDVSASVAFVSPAGGAYNRFSFDGSSAAVPAAFAPEISPLGAVATPMPSVLTAARPGWKQHASVKKQSQKKKAAAGLPPTAIAVSSSSSSTAASSTERGRRFRKRLQEREVQARSDIELLRQQILRIQSLKRSGQQQALFNLHRDLCLSVASSNELGLATAMPQLRSETRLVTAADGGAALRFVREYFALFRFGVLSPEANPNGTTTGVALDTSRQEAFLSQWAVPDVEFDEFVGVTPMVDQWRRYSSVHSFIKLDPVSMEVQVIDNRATVVAKGVLHIRYSRRTLESVLPRLISQRPALAERLVGRLVHMHYTSHYFFDDSGRLVSQQIVPDFVSALKEVLGSLDDVAKVLDCALLKEHVLGEVDYDRFEKKRAAEAIKADERPAAAASGEEHDASPGLEARSASGMDIEFLLS